MLLLISDDLSIFWRAIERCFTVNRIILTVRDMLVLSLYVLCFYDVV